LNESVRRLADSRASGHHGVPLATQRPSLPRAANTLQEEMPTVNTRPVRLALPILSMVAGAAMTVAAMAKPTSEAGPKLAHVVFFTLKDHSEKARDAFIASCEEYLDNHEGAEFFAIGTQADDVVEPGVGVRDFDVALHVVFASKEDEAAYLKHPRHLEFVEKNKPLFSKVRVFDSYVTKTKP
jgi:hypothetical protein